MTATVKIRKKGQITLPADIREKLDIDENEIINIQLIGNGGILLIPQKLQTAKILQETAALAKQRGVTLEEMLAELDAIRHKS